MRLSLLRCFFTFGARPKRATERVMATGDIERRWFARVNDLPCFVSSAVLLLKISFIILASSAYARRRRSLDSSGVISFLLLTFIHHYMALTQSARIPGPGSLWDEEVVPALRKRNYIPDYLRHSLNFT